MWAGCVAGCAAGAAATVVTYPMETLRTHMALGGQSYRQCLADVLRAHGHRGLYKGFTSGVVSPAAHSVTAPHSQACTPRVLTGNPVLDSPGRLHEFNNFVRGRCRDVSSVPALQPEPLRRRLSVQLG